MKKIDTQVTANILGGLVIFLLSVLMIIAAIHIYGPQR